MLDEVDLKFNEDINKLFNARKIYYFYMYNLFKFHKIF